MCFFGVSVQPQIIPISFGEETFNVGDSTSLTCSVHKGDLPINFSWIHKNVSIGYMDGIIISNVGQKNTMLTIDSVMEHHVGLYTCIAENKAGVARSSAELNVNGISYLMNNFFSSFFIVFPITDPNNRVTLAILFFIIVCDSCATDSNNFGFNFK